MSKKNREAWHAIVEANARLIVDAVNERERLLDIVRRFIDLFTPGTIHPAGTMERLLCEARAAIGAGEKPTEEWVGK